MHPELPVHKHLKITKSSSENCYLLSGSGCCCKMKDRRVILSRQQSFSSVNEKGGRAKCLQRLLKYCHKVAKSSLQALFSVLNALFSRIFQLERKLISKVKSSSYNKRDMLTITHSKHFSFSLFYKMRQVPAADKPFLIPWSQI